MKISRIVLVIGIVLFVGSFFLTAVKETSAPVSSSGFKGYLCAYLTLLMPWGRDGMRTLHDHPASYFAVLFSGWINPVFLVTLIFLHLRRLAKLGNILRVVLVLMFAAPWFVFYQEHLYPVAGYFVWTAAMLMGLFANAFAQAKATTA